MMSRLLTSAAVTIAAISVAGVAAAGSNHSSHHSTLPSLSSWSGSTGASYSHNGTSSRYSPSTSYATTMSSMEADSHYGTGSISESYTTADTYSFSGSTSSVAGLGYNESLRATSCPVNVHGTSSGSTVLGCYNVVKPVPRTTYYRVVRPIVYVRYPVPVPVPVASPCASRCGGVVVNNHYSRYGGYGPQGGYGGYKVRQHNTGSCGGPVCR